MRHRCDITTRLSKGFIIIRTQSFLHHSASYLLHLEYRASSQLVIYKAENECRRDKTTSTSFSSFFLSKLIPVPIDDVNVGRYVKA